MAYLGFKKLTLDNWLESDKASSSFVDVSAVNGKLHPITGDEWMQKILKPNLIEEVPIEVQQLFEVARGALAYGYFFYPLYTLAEEQLFRVAEAALTFKCKSMGAPHSISTFQQKIEYLTVNKVIFEQEKETWHIIRKLRNVASHPERQTLLTPGMVISVLERITNSINSLFSSK